MKSKLIVIEGLDGSGKATQTKILKETLSSEFENVRQITFPNYESPSGEIVKMYLSGEFGKNANDVNAYTSSSFYAIDRFTSYKTDWEKNYKNGDIIVADRYTTSNAIYQLAKIEENQKEDFLNWLYDYEYNKLLLPKPDLVIYLDVDPDVSQKLMEKRYKGDNNKKDLHEKDVNFLKNCRTQAFFVAKKWGWQIINCTSDNNIRSIEDISSDILKEVRKIIK